MTMHLARGLTTINTKKRKKKPLTQKQIEDFTVKWRQHNKSMRKKGMHDLQYDTVEDYIAYCRGEYKPKTKPQAFTPWQPEYKYQRETPHYPSLSNSVPTGGGTKKESMKYTGERKLVGIAMMHKSNLVPVFADEDDKTGSKQATEIAQMRRN
jgi:hypothetical protein